MDRQVIILRGISGSGKSTYIKNNYPNALICSADDYFCKDDQNNYNYDPAKIEQAHIACFTKFLQAVSSDQPLVVIDNTNTELWEVSPYYMTAKTFGYKVMVITLVCNCETATKRNIHEVSIENNEHYVKKFQPSLPFWPGMVIPTD